MEEKLDSGGIASTSASSQSTAAKATFKNRLWPKRAQKSKDTTTAVKESEIDPLAHLPQHEQEILRRQLDVPTVKISYATLFRFSTGWDKLWMALGSLGAIGGGIAIPLMTVVFGGLTQTFSSFLDGTLAYDDFSHALGHYTLYFVYLAIAEFVCIYVATACWLFTGEHLTQMIREQYLAAILRQNIGFYDKVGAGEITTRITSDMNVIQESISEKVSLTMTGLATFVAALV